MCSGKGAGSPQGNTGIVPPQGGMQQFANLQNQYFSPDSTRTGVTPYNTGNPSLMASGGMMNGGPVQSLPASGADQMGGNYTTQGTINYGGGGPNTGAYGTGGGDPYAVPAGTGGIKPAPGASPNGMIQYPRLPPQPAELGLLGGGNVAANWSKMGQTANPYSQSQGIDPVTGGQIPPDWMYPGNKAAGGLTPAQWAAAHPGGPAYGSGQSNRPNGGVYPGGPGMGPAHDGVSKYASSPYNPANRDPNAGANRMAAAAAYQQSLTPEMIQQQINNGQRAPGTNAQTQAMLANMSPAQRQAYIDKMKTIGLDPTYSGTATGSGPFGN